MADGADGIEIVLTTKQAEEAVGRLEQRLISMLRGVNKSAADSQKIVDSFKEGFLDFQKEIAKTGAQKQLIDLTSLQAQRKAFDALTADAIAFHKVLKELNETVARLNIERGNPAFSASNLAAAKTELQLRERLHAVQAQSTKEAVALKDQINAQVEATNRLLSLSRLRREREGAVSGAAESAAALRVELDLLNRIAQAKADGHIRNMLLLREAEEIAAANKQILDTARAAAALKRARSDDAAELAKAQQLLKDQLEYNKAVAQSGEEVRRLRADTLALADANKKALDLVQARLNFEHAKSAEGRQKVAIDAQTAALERSTRAAVALDAEMVKLNAATSRMSEAAKAFEILERHSGSSSQAIAKLVTEAQHLQSQLSADFSAKGAEELLQKLKAITAEMQKMAAAEARAAAGLAAPSTGSGSPSTAVDRRAELARIRAEANQAREAMAQLNSTVALTRNAFDALGRHISVYAGGIFGVSASVYGIVASFKEAVSTFSEFDKNLQRVQAVAQETARGMEALKTESLSLAKSSRFTSIESSQAMIELGQAGLKTNEILVALAPTLQLASIGELKLAQAADYATSIMYQFQLAAKDIPHIVDVIAQASVDSNATVKELAATLSYAGPVAEAFGISLEMMAAAAEVLHNSGIKGQRAGTGLRQTIMSLYEPTAKGEAVLNKAGVAVSDLGGNAVDLQTILEKLNSSVKQNLITFGDLRDVVGIRAYPAFLQLVKGADEGTNSLRTFYDANLRAVGAAAQMQRTIEDSLAIDWDKLKSALQVLSIQLVETFSEDARKLIQSVTKAINELTSDPDKIKELAHSIETAAKAVTYFVGMASGLYAVVKTIDLLGGGKLWEYGKALLGVSAAAKAAKAAISGTEAAAETGKAFEKALGVLKDARWALAFHAIKVTAVGAIAAIAYSATQEGSIANKMLHALAEGAVDAAKGFLGLGKDARAAADAVDAAANASRRFNEIKSGNRAADARIAAAGLDIAGSKTSTDETIARALAAIQANNNKLAALEKERSAILAAIETAATPEAAKSIALAWFRVEEDMAAVQEDINRKRDEMSNASAAAAKADLDLQSKLLAQRKAYADSLAKQLSSEWAIYSKYAEDLKKNPADPVAQAAVEAWKAQVNATSQRLGVVASAVAAATGEMERTNALIDSTIGASKERAVTVAANVLEQMRDLENAIAAADRTSEERLADYDRRVREYEDMARRVKAAIKQVTGSDDVKQTLTPAQSKQVIDLLKDQERAFKNYFYMLANGAKDEKERHRLRTQEMKESESQVKTLTDALHNLNKADEEYRKERNGGQLPDFNIAAARATIQELDVQIEAVTKELRAQLETAEFVAQAKKELGQESDSKQFLEWIIELENKLDLLRKQRKDTNTALLASEKELSAGYEAAVKLRLEKEGELAALLAAKAEGRSVYDANSIDGKIEVAQEKAHGLTVLLDSLSDAELSLFDSAGKLNDGMSLVISSGADGSQTAITTVKEYMHALADTLNVEGTYIGDSAENTKDRIKAALSYLRKELQELGRAQAAASDLAKAKAEMSAEGRGAKSLEKQMNDELEKATALAGGYDRLRERMATMPAVYERLVAASRKLNDQGLPEIEAPVSYKEATVNFIADYAKMKEAYDNVKAAAEAMAAAKENGIQPTKEEIENLHKLNLVLAEAEKRNGANSTAINKVEGPLRAKNETLKEALIAEQEEYELREAAIKLLQIEGETRYQAALAVAEHKLATLDMNEASEAQVALIKEQIEHLRKLASWEIKGNEQAKREAAIKKLQSDYKSLANQLENDMTNALMRAFDKGGSFAESFKEFLNDLFKDLVIKPIVQMIVAPFAQGMASMFYPGVSVPGYGSSAMGGQSFMGGFSNMMSWFNGNSIGQGFSSFGTFIDDLTGVSQQVAQITADNAAWAQMAANFPGEVQVVPQAVPGLGNALSGAAAMPNWAYGAAGMLGGLGGSMLFPNSPYSGMGGSLGAMGGMALGSSFASTLGMAASVAGPIGAVIGMVAGAALGNLLDSGPDPERGYVAWSTRAQGFMDREGSPASRLPQQVIPEGFQGGFTGDGGAGYMDFGAMSQTDLPAEAPRTYDLSENLKYGAKPVFKGTVRFQGDEEQGYEALGNYTTQFGAVRWDMQNGRMSQQQAEAFNAIMQTFANIEAMTASLAATSQEELEKIQKAIADTFVDTGWTEDFNATMTEQMKDRQRLILTTIDAGFGTLLDSLDSSSLEAYAKDLSSLIGGFKTVSDVIKTLTGDSLKFTAAWVQASKAILEAAGGMEAFTAGATLYFDKFYSDAEKHQAVTRQVSDLFKTLNLAVPDTRAGFRELVESLDLTTEAGQNAYGKLIVASGMMDSFFSGLESGVSSAVGSVKDLAGAVEKVADTVKDLISDTVEFRKSLANTIKEVTGEKPNVQDLRLAVLANFDTTDAEAVKSRISLAEEYITAITDNYYSQKAAIDESISAEISKTEYLKEAGKALKEFAAELSVTEASGLTPGLRLIEARSQYQTLLAGANAGDLDSAQRLGAAATDYLALARDKSASSVEYRRIVARVAAELGNTGDKLLSTEENTAKWQADLLAIQTSAASLLKELDSGAQWLQTRLEEQSKSIESLLEVLNSSTLSVAAAVKRVEDAIRAGYLPAGTGGVTVGGSVTQPGSSGGASTSGRSPLWGAWTQADTPYSLPTPSAAQISALAPAAIAGYATAVWNDTNLSEASRVQAIATAQRQYQVSDEELAAATGWSVDAIRTLSLQYGMRGYATGGIASGPASGYPVLLHGEEAVVPLPDGRSIPVALDLSTLIEEIRGLRADIQAGQVPTIKAVQLTAKTLQKWDYDGQPETRV